MSRPRWRKKRWLIPGVYALLVIASFTWQTLVPGAPQPLPADYEQVALAPQRAAGSASGAPVRLAYRDLGPRDAEAIVLLHGSPGSASNFNRLAPRLAERYRVIVPDLPGFGASDAWIPDYSIKAHARYVLALMDELGVDTAHVLGYSLGSGVALHVNELAPERVRSLIFYGGIGIQEGEGSGDYTFEHIKYAVGYGVFVVGFELVPHFGYLGPRGMRHGFIRNFYDTDMRPLRRLLETLDKPLLILHGKDDFLVHPWVAREHHAIVEHSELVMFDASHFMVFDDDGTRRLADEITPFVERAADATVAPTRRTVDPYADAADAAAADDEALPSKLKIERGLSPWTQILIICGAVWVSEDLTCISAGLLVRRGELDLFVAIFGCFIGIFLSDFILFLGGRIIGRRLLRWNWLARRLPPERVDRFGGWFDRHIWPAVIAARFVPGTRVPMYIAAGIVSRRAVTFAIVLLLAAFIWTPLLVIFVAVFGQAFITPFEAVFGAGWLSLIAAALLLLVIVRVVMLSLTWRGRVRLIASVSRLWRWEFWPTWLFYIPIVGWIALLMLRHRSVTLFTAANPAIPHGGFLGESKSAILRHLPAEAVLDACLVEPGEPAARLAAVRDYAEQHGWSLPVIVKPDEGYRGMGVKLAHTWDEAEQYLAAHEPATLVQTYHPGPYEAGVFYYRLPGDAAGRILAITDKHFPVITGDGESTLEVLILRHPRFRMQAGTFLRRHADRADDVLAAGETLRLAMAGNHCQGTEFRDGAHLITPALEKRMDEVAKQFEGFYFGRFDLRYSDVERFTAGEEIHIIEVNGVTSEATNIYDPTWPLWRAYRLLFRQWAIAFEIGRRNRAAGVAPSTIRAIARDARRHWRRRKADKLSD